MAQWDKLLVAVEVDEWELLVVVVEVVVGEPGGASGTNGGIISSRDHVEDCGDCGESESGGDCTGLGRSYERRGVGPVRRWGLRRSAAAF